MVVGGGGAVPWYVWTQPAFIEAIEYALGEEQDDGALRSLAAICIAQFTLTDKENKYTPVVLLAMLDGVVPTELPKLKDEEVKEVFASFITVWERS